MEIANLLIDNEATINAMAKNGSHPLDWAIKFENEELAALLLKHGGENGKALK